MSIGEWLFAGFILVIATVGFIGGLLEVIKSAFGTIPTKDYTPGQHTKNRKKR